MKKLGIAFAIILAIVVLGIGYVVATFDANRIKSEITRAVKDSKQRNLQIDGELSLSFWPNVGVKLGHTTLSEHGSDQLFASLDSVRVSVAVMPLLSKQLVVDTVELAGARATLVQHKDGTLNIDDLLSKDKQESQTVRFDVTGIKISNAQLDWRDEKSGQTATIAKLDLSTGRIANAASGKLDLSAHLVANSMANPAKSEADLNLSGQYDFDLEQKRFGLAKLDAAVKGELAGIQGLDLQVTAAALQAQPAKQALTAEALVVSAKGKQGGDNFDVRLEVPKLTVTPEQAGGDSVTLTATLSGTQRNASVKLALAGVTGSAKAIKVTKLALDIDAKQGATSLKGTLQSDFAANLDAQTVDLAKFSGAFDIAHPQMPMKTLKLPISGGARADLAKQTAAVSLATQFDESKIAAQFDVGKFSPLALGFAIDIDRLNVDKYLPPKAVAAKPAAGGKADDKLDLSLLKNLDVHGTLKIGALQVSNVKAANIRLDVRGGGGKLDIAPLSANLYGGALAGSASLNANGNAVAVKQTLSNININPLMVDLAGKDLVEGRGNVVVDINSHGDSVTAMKKALAGSAGVNLKDGALKGINLAQTLRDVKGKLGAKQDRTQQANKSDKTDFSELTASFKIAAGVAHNDDLAMKSPFIRLGGNGDIDIGNGTMNYVAKASVVNTAGGQGAKDLDQLKGLTVPVRISGPFENLSFKLELAGLVTEAANAKVEEKKQEVQKKAVDQLKSLLRR
jgi:AsmA protein